MGIGPIPFTSIIEYFNVYELGEVENFEDFSYVMRHMDKVYLSINNEGISKSSKGGSKSNAARLTDKKHRNKD